MHNKKVIVFGTFDILHPWHLDYFRQAKKFGDFLTVIVARDNNVEKIKGKLPRKNELSRLKELKKHPVINKAVLGNLKDKYLVLQKESPAVICLGYDQKVDIKELQKKLKEYKLNKVEMVRLKSFQPDIYKSSLLG